MITPAIDVAGRDGRAVSLTAQQVDELATRIEGSVLMPREPGWNAAVLTWNAMVRRIPAVVVQPVTARDVATAVGFARGHGLLLSIKGGGHHIAGTSLAKGGLTLDMSRMKEITVDP